MSQPPGGPQSATPGGPPTGYQPNKRLQQTQAQVDEVVDIMRVNVDKVLERDQKLSELDDRADALQAGASQFEASAGKLKNKYWWKNMKMTLIMGGVGGVFVIVIVVWLASGSKGANEAAAAPYPISNGNVNPGSNGVQPLPPSNADNQAPQKPLAENPGGGRRRRSVKLWPNRTGLSTN
jgi:hypothetical protein